MSSLVLQLALAPALVGVSSLACNRWGERAGGLLSAFPAIVGPFLLIAAAEHGARFASLAADATLSGLLALSAFSLAYGRTALHHGWRASLAAGWAAAGALSLLAAGLAAQPPAGVLLAVSSLVLAHRGLPARAPASAPARPPRWETPTRMALTALLVAVLALAATRFGSLVGGALAALPALASVLAVSTHRRCGAGATVTLIRGMLAGMAGFVLFCQAIALLVVPAGIVVAFSLATFCAVAAQVLVAHLGRAPALEAPGRSQTVAPRSSPALFTAP